MEKVFESKITALKSSKTRIYPTIRLPKEYLEIIGKKADIFLTEHKGKLAFLVVVDAESLNFEVEDTLETRLSKLEKQFEELYTIVPQLKTLINHSNTKTDCRRGDLNPRPPDYESGAPTS